MDPREYRKVIDDPRAPQRLRFRTIVVTVTPGSDMTFRCDLPDDATAQEKGYLSWYVGEFVDELKRDLPDLIGDKTETIRP